MRLHPIVNDAKRRLWCGPAALCLIAGIPASKAYQLIEDRRGPTFRRLDGSRYPVTGASLDFDLCPALKRLGYVVRSVPGPFPTLVQWLECPERDGSTTYLVNVPKHFLVVRGRQGGDNSTGGPVPLVRLPFRDEPVEKVIEVTRELMTAAGFKDARRRLGMSAAALADLLRLGKGGDRTVRRWESGAISVPGPVQVAVELLLERKPR